MRLASCVMRHHVLFAVLDAPFRPLEHLVRRHQQLVGIDQAAAAHAAAMKNENMLQLGQHLIAVTTQWGSHMYFRVFQLVLGKSSCLPALAFFQHGDLIALFGKPQGRNTAAETRNR